MAVVLILAIFGSALMTYRRQWMLPILTISMPLERIPSFELFDITVRPNMILFTWAAILLAIGWLRRGKEIVFKREDWLLGLYILIGVIALPFAIEPNRGAMVVMFTTFVFGVFLIIRSLVINDKVVSNSSKLIIIASSLICIFGLYQYLGEVFGLPSTWTGIRDLYEKGIFGFPRVHSTLLEPMYLANFLLIPLSLLIVSQLTASKTSFGKWIYPITVLNGTVFILTVSRGGFVGLIVSVLLIVVLLAKYVNWRRVPMLLATVVLSVIIGMSLISLPSWIGQKGDTRLADVFAEHVTDRSDFSSTDRLARGRVALDAWRSSPWIGVGLGNYGPYAARKYGGDNRQTVNIEILEMLAESGVLGTGMIVVFLTVVIWRAVGVLRGEVAKERRLLIGAGLAALGGIIVQYQTLSSLYIVYIWFFIGWLSGLIYRADEQEEAHECIAR